MMALPHPISPWTRKPSLNGWSITNTATLVSSLSFTARSVVDCTMNEEFKDYKIVKLPPNGPKPGQSTRAWLYGKGKEEEEFQKLIDAQSFKGKRK
jgi:hypothetical protein